MSRHPIHDIDDDVHQRVRLGILASLDGLARADFTHLKTSLELTDGNLGRHLQALEVAGLITQTKSTGGGRPRTWIKVTPKGRRALHDEIRALERLLGSEGGRKRDSVAFGSPRRVGLPAEQVPRRSRLEA